MRRKNAQNPPDRLPLPPNNAAEEPSYDPRIRGTRVHDFSAPRRKPYAASNDNGLAPKVSNGAQSIAHKKSLPELPNDRGQEGDEELPALYQRHTSTGEPAVGATRPESAEGIQRRNNTSTSSEPSLSQRGHSQVQRKAVPASLRHQTSNSSTVDSNATAVSAAKSAASAKANHARNISMASEISAKSHMSSVPRHMKSTSSRFSFDMIGAAKQEKILEERHRQREAEKKEMDAANPRDSRFDDFDEDAFDYDAMMDDDGLEERIPGVNADLDDDDYYLEEEMMDPDNDQENFSGFAFQRSHGSPVTPIAHQEEGGNSPNDLESGTSDLATPSGSADIGTGSSLVSSEHTATAAPEPAGLGIHNAGIQEAAVLQSTTIDNTRKAEDDLYFDDGLIGDDNPLAEDLAASPEWDDTPFDESIFDNNDTDQYGRPVPGAFAQAQSQRQAANQDATKRESDMTSRFSAQSKASGSTAHTSLSAGAPSVQHEAVDKSAYQEAASRSNSVAADSSPMAAYQAALAAAAYQAAASGKFMRSSSPAGDETEDDNANDSTPNLGTAQYTQGMGLDDDDDDDDYGFSYENMDDFDVDDDAIVAEANASALANDSDGWYGQEFGFYSAPMSQHGQHSSSSNGAAYLYSNGGFFGPKGLEGVNRSASGRVVSREPNLTPITERSEYSNRNSMMSMALPWQGPGTPIQSPGLAQLAMMAETSDEMSLSSLLRLRSRAWGGSQISLASSREGSPKSDRGELPSAPWAGSYNGPSMASSVHGRKNSVYSAISYDSESCSLAESPTVTMHMSMPNSISTMQNDVPTGPTKRLSSSSQPEQSHSSLLSGSELVAGSLSSASARSHDGAFGRRSGMGHQHKNSADSISYTKEEESGETRWVIERRRVADSGEVEVLEREVIEGGRI
jgi:hypothetical protein